MIKIISKYDCCGCSACAQRCPHNAIELTQDNEGFLYPQINLSICTNCGLCKRVCPIINQELPSEPVKAFAAKNNDENIRQQSSSGGIFTLIASEVINNGGVVFGAKYNSTWEVEHDYTDTINGLAKFRGSKYVQSKIGNNYILAEEYLKDGKQVLFSGTPCQIAGLKRFLRKEYENLICVDIICHGVPSPNVWNKYITNLQKKGQQIKFVSHRDKTNGWKLFGVKIDSTDGTICNETLQENIYLKVFLQNLCLRPSCYKCQTLSGKSKSDITIADFWGIQHLHPDFDDDKGCNLVLINSEKGLNLFNELECDKIETDFNTAIKYNPSYFKSVAEPKYRKYFFDNFDKYGFAIYDKICKKQQPSLIRRIASRCKRMITK